jgi:hypothetical protein
LYGYSTQTKKQKQMKYLMILLIVLGISCTKTNVTYKHHWIAKEGHDISTWSHAAFCFAYDSIGMDIVELDNTTAYDSTKFGMHRGSIVFHSRVKVSDSLYDRKYCQLKVQID